MHQPGQHTSIGTCTSELNTVIVSRCASFWCGCSGAVLACAHVGGRAMPDKPGRRQSRARSNGLQCTSMPACAPSGRVSWLAVGCSAGFTRVLVLTARAIAHTNETCSPRQNKMIDKGAIISPLKQYFHEPLSSNGGCHI